MIGERLIARKRSLWRTFTVLACVAGLAGCAGLSKGPASWNASMDPSRAYDENAVVRKQDAMWRGGAPGETATPVPPPAPADASSFSASDLLVPQFSPESGERRIVIYTATLTIVVTEIEDALKQAEVLAKESGGWVQEIRGERITIRVPAERYQDVESKMEALGRVSQRQLEAADITEQFVDLEARLKNALAVRERLNNLLARAENVQAAIEVEKELKRVGEEIERFQAKLELLKNRVAYSTITATFERVYREAPLPHLMKLPFAWLRDLRPERLMQDY